MVAKSILKKYRQGFTIVELIIVITIIAILATIMFASYTGVQNQAKTEDARANAASVRKAAEGYYKSNNVYPTQVAHFSSTFVSMPSDIILLTSGSLSTDNGKDSIMYRYVNGGAGACVSYWEFAPDTGPAGAVTSARLGSATSGNCSATVGTLPS